MTLKSTVQSDLAEEIVSFTVFRAVASVPAGGGWLRGAATRKVESKD